MFIRSGILTYETGICYISRALTWHTNIPRIPVFVFSLIILVLNEYEQFWILKVIHKRRVSAEVKIWLHSFVLPVFDVQDLQIPLHNFLSPFDISDWIAMSRNDIILRGSSGPKVGALVGMLYKQLNSQWEKHILQPNFSVVIHSPQQNYLGT